jgi:hypothetical protein
MNRCSVGMTHSGRAPSNNRQLQIERIQDWYQEAMRLMVLGWSNERIADHFRVTVATICTIRNSDLTRRQIDIMQAARSRSIMTVTEKLDDSAPRAAEVLDEMLNDPSVPAAVRKGVAFGILDRTGNGPTTKIEGKFAVGIFEKKDLEELQRRRDAALEQGVLVTVEDSQEIKE